jgi:hypothetical protein
MTPVAVEVAAGQPADGLLVPLWPGSEISGALRDAHDRALTDMGVRIIPAANEVAWIGAHTDTGGRYHAGRLWPGRYRVVVPVRRGDAAGEVEAGGDGQVTFLTTFAPDTADVASARQIDLGVGEHQRGVDVRMRTASAASLSGVIDAAIVPGTFFRLQLVRSRELDRLDLADARLRLDHPGPFTVHELPRASYTLEVERMVEGSDAMVYWPVRVPVSLADGDATVHVRFGDDTPLNTSVEVDDTVARRVTTVQGQVRDTNGHDGVRVVAFPVDRRLWVEWGAVPEILLIQPLDEDGAFEIVGLPPGEYFVRAVHEARLAEWPLPYVLTRLALGAARLTLEPGESRQIVLDVR